MLSFRIKSLINYCKTFIVIITICSFCNTIFANDNILSKCFIPIDLVYHGSPNKNLTILDPLAESIRDPKNRMVVFATSSIQVASCYLFKWDNSWVQQLVLWKNNELTKFEVYMVISDYKRFKNVDAGGAIYFLPAKNFNFNHSNNYDNNGLGIYESTSSETIIPFTKMYFSSAMDAMKTFKVKVYFINKHQFKLYTRLSITEKNNFLAQLKQH